MMKGLNGEKECEREERGTIFSVVVKIYHMITCFEYQSEGVPALRQIYGEQ